MILVNIIGVVAKYQAYIVDSKEGFNLLLSSYQISRVRYIYNYRKGIVTIINSTGYRIVIFDDRLSGDELLEYDKDKLEDIELGQKALI